MTRFDFVLADDGAPALTASTAASQSPPTRDRHPVPARVRELLEQTEAGRALLSEPIRSEPAPRTTKPTTTTHRRESAMGDQTRYLTEPEVKRRLNLTDADLRSSELLMHLGARGTAEPGVMVFPRAIVERGELYLAECQEAAERGAELLLSEAGHPHLAHDGPYSVRKRGDAVLAEMREAGLL